jgi:hypothetical protein
MYNIVKVSISGRSFKTDTGIDETLLITNVSNRISLVKLYYTF